MRRILALALIAFAAACSRQGPGPVTPEPGVPPDDAQDLTALPADTALLPPPSSFAEEASAGEVAGEIRLAADSAADQALLDQLADAHPDDAAVDDEGEALTGAVTWDIDVESFASHDRVQYYLDFFQTVGRERFAIWLSRMPRYEPMIRERLQREGLPGDLVYLALIESGFSNTAVSRSRAVGMWQFMKGTAKGYGLRIDSWVDERRDPVKATDAAARFLSDLHERFGSLYLAAAAYNGGPGRVSRGIRRLPGDDDDETIASDATFFRLYDTRLLRRETKDYVPKLIAAALIAKQPELYGFTPVAAPPVEANDSLVVPDMTGLDVIARLADTTVAAIRALNPQYLRLATPPGRSSVVRLPPGRGEATRLAYAALPPSKRVTFREHFVTRGQTISGIALRYGVSQRELLEANPRVRPRALRVGQRLVIPVGGATSMRVARQMAEGEARGAEYHVVRRGETLSELAERYDVKQSDLRKWNRLSGSRIKIGQRLRVAARSTGRTHLVRRGDTLTGLAKRYGVSIQALKEANGLSNGMIRTGTRLRIPG